MLRRLWNYPGTSSGGGRSKEKEEENENYSQLEKAESKFTRYCSEQESQSMFSQKRSKTIAKIHRIIPLGYNRTFEMEFFIR